MLRGRWYRSAASAAVQPRTPFPSFWTGGLTLRRLTRGSGLAGGFQRAQKLVFVAPSAVYLAFCPSRYVPRCSEWLRFERFHMFLDQLVEDTWRGESPDTSGTVVAPKESSLNLFSLRPWVVLSVWLWGPFLGFPGLRQVSMPASPGVSNGSELHGPNEGRNDGR